jgi:hypothetical protein
MTSAGEAIAIRGNKSVTFGASGSGSPDSAVSTYVFHVRTTGLLRKVDESSTIASNAAKRFVEKAMKVDGRCHCGAVAYEAEVVPGTMAICHCSDCQMLTGSAYRANIPAPAESFHIIKGVPRTYVKTGDSGVRRIHAFCENCGSPIYSCAVDNPRSYSLRVGALTQRYELGPPARQIWTKRRFSWLPPLDAVSEVEGQP